MQRLVGVLLVLQLHTTAYGYTPRVLGHHKHQQYPIHHEGEQKQAVRQIASLSEEKGVFTRPQELNQPEEFISDAQVGLIEEAWWSQQRHYLAEIAALTGDEFNGVKLSVYDDGLKLLWDFFPPLYPCPLLWRAGMMPSTGDGAKWICGAPLINRSSCLIYSFGCNGDTAFEQEMLNRTSCEVHVFDPTLDDMQRQAVENVPGIHFHPYGLGGSNGEVAAEHFTTGYGRVQSITVKTLETIMEELGHDWVDVLKVDIEASEYAFLDAYLSTGKPIPASQMQVEFHYWRDNAMTVPRDIMKTLTELTADGRWRAFHMEPNLWYGNNGISVVEYAFLHMTEGGRVMNGNPSTGMLIMHASHLPHLQSEFQEAQAVRQSEEQQRHREEAAAASERRQEQREHENKRKSQQRHQANSHTATSVQQLVQLQQEQQGNQWDPSSSSK